MGKSNTLFQELLNFRVELFDQYEKNKISPEDFGNRSFNYLRQNRIKFVKKAHGLEDIVLNYHYWSSRIERGVSVERELERYGVASEELLNKKLFMLVKRRDQMVRRLLLECLEEVEVEYCNLVHEDLVEIKILEYKLPFYCGKEALDKIKFRVDQVKNSEFSYYLPFLFYSLPLEKR